jgi:hypothetical protein
MDVKRWQQGQLRELSLKTLEHIDWEGKTQPEILGEARGLFEDVLLALYDATSTMFSRFLRTVTTIDADTGSRTRAIWRDRQGRYWRWETLRNNPELMQECLQSREQYLREDAVAHNRLADAMFSATGTPYPHVQIVRQLSLDLFSSPSQERED